MKLPNKATSYSESIFPAMTELLNRVCRKNYSVLELFAEVKSSLAISDFYAALDALFILGKIDWSSIGEELCYVD